MEIKQTMDAALIAKLNEPVQALHAALYPEYFKPYCFAEIRQWFERVIASDPDSTFLVIEDEDQITGYAWIQVLNRKENPFKKARTVLEIHQFSIMQAARRKGCGTFLMNDICQFAKNKGIKEIDLNYWSDNETAERFYRKQNFKIYRKAAHRIV
ncbi:GNAT family N-acetyltransferase [Sporolactobacillus shoreicorticis]|uniref:GNAT family N-acetyltransferase n=1 Tax=Sporolactobacillus shoreicorticis TaxID=1923877 RepID=A0ABW5S205_9BACL|nr:GNAT family N-acetyltransferase [Sporolactobacillus shoreicorticis]MCO7125444.1 GNAT family N-acetyltransferase [Sporolactobacillus shoreicorticis]